MRVEFSDIGQVDDKELKFAVISSSFQGKWLFVKHKQRDTWEIPSGHRELVKIFMILLKENYLKKVVLLILT